MDRRLVCLIGLFFVLDTLPPISSARADASYDGEWTNAKPVQYSSCYLEKIRLVVTGGNLGGEVGKFVFRARDVGETERVVKGLMDAGADRVIVGSNEVSTGPATIEGHSVPIVGVISSDGKVEGKIGGFSFEGRFAKGRFSGTISPETCSMKIKLRRPT